MIRHSFSTESSDFFSTSIWHCNKCRVRHFVPARSIVSCIFSLGGDFIKRDRKGLLCSTNSPVKSIARRVQAVLGVFLQRCTDRPKLHFIRQSCRWHAHRERGSRPIFAKVLNYTSVSNERRNVVHPQILCVGGLRSFFVRGIFENRPPR